MDTEPSSYREWEAVFSTQVAAQLATAIVEPESPPPLPKIAALRNRFLDIAFHEKSTQPNIRLLAACWVRSLESLIVALHINDDERLALFQEDKNSGIKLAMEHGYASAIYLASEMAPGFLDRLFGGQAATDEQLALRSQLLETAFGAARLNPSGA